jgi:hypothetical protein
MESHICTRTHPNSLRTNTVKTLNDTHPTAKIAIITAVKMFRGSVKISSFVTEGFAYDFTKFEYLDG